ncbi:ATP-dependent RecD-like DNA helicase [Clostridium sp. AF32-12BH]|uniref:SF1B family DNA helicase RecD2 n=1 Tax=Clostridium sp. AF32-12BH TaxID=2292006 RepID=UPI000E4CD40E|nr:ATP-dependent RecD-like DNA helicase [Clostridium sp. AF32-12BH]RHP47234.1 ATP-dependent RecD-like DNA helicase [Clostridium sp. AF32-12BH]
MATVSGYVERIKYRNEENGYSILDVSADGLDYVLVGTFPYISEGDFIEATGREVEHPIYGEQIQVESYELKAPEDTASMERYLGSGAIRGVGTALAARIVRRFKADTFRIIEEEPERLAEVKGISEKMARAISEQMESKKEMRQAMMFLQDYGISMNLALKIYNEYGSRMYGIIKENPYRLADDIQGVGFKMADEIAQKVGIFTDSDFRIRSGIYYTLLQSVTNGHTYLPQEELLAAASELLHVDPSVMEKHLTDLQIEKKIVVKVDEEHSAAPSRHVYASQYYYTELNTARMLHDLNLRGSEPETEIRKKLEVICAEEKIEPDELQIRAVIEAVNSGLLIITGGPGTGKTTTINTIIRYFEQEEMEILLAAPTGRAAKRMTEATGYEARTIHRLLELTGVPSDDKDTSGMHFERNEENPLEADAIIIDEMSMVDIYLMHALLRAVNPGTRLILVGDINQLPSVGPGNVLRDMIASGAFNVVQLTRIFRQAAESDIIVNAHKINDGEQIPLGKRSKDFLFIRREHPDAIISAMLTLVREKLPNYVHADMFDIQIMTPMRKGALGVERLNTILQSFLNPKDPSKPEKEVNGTIYRVGDKVMQIKNNYQIEWETRNKYGIPIDSGAGVFNGDIGIIREINTFAEELTVEFDEGKMVDYSFKQLEELELAYAITIHKSQGSEYPAVVIPVYSGPRMLMTRNLIYTAVTRARACVCLVGIPEMLQTMVDNVVEQRRYTGLKIRIQEVMQSEL